MKRRALVITALVAALLPLGAAPAAAVGPGTWYGEYYVQEFVADEFVALAICLDGAGNVYVSGWDPSNGGELRIRKYSSSGTLLLTFGDEGVGNGLLEDASHMCVDKAGNIYVLDKYAARVNRYGPTGAFIAEWNTAPGATQRPAPNGITVDAAGYIYVGEGQGDKSIRKFNSNGGLVATFVNYGSAAGQLSSVCDLEYAPSGHIYTVEGNICRVQKFTLSGGYVAGWSVPKVVSWGIASCVAVGGGGNVYVWEGNACRGDSRLFTYSPSGTLLSTYDPFAFGFSVDSP
jgi:tripartite motif-containing protein 71